MTPFRGDEITRMRNRLGLSKQGLADICGVNISSVHRWEASALAIIEPLQETFVHHLLCLSREPLARTYGSVLQSALTSHPLFALHALLSIVFNDSRFDWKPTDAA